MATVTLKEIKLTPEQVAEAFWSMNNIGMTEEEQ